MSQGSSQAGQSQQAREFQRRASQSSHGLVREFADFLLYNKKWWLTPILFVLLLLGALVLLGGTGLSPFMYTLF